MDKIRSVKEDLEDVTEMMRMNIESVVDRGEHLELLVDKSEGFSSQARAFQAQSKGLREALWWKNAKMMASLGGCVLFALLIVLMFVCGWDFHSCKRA